MATATAYSKRPVFDRLGGSTGSLPVQSNQTCRYWLQGRCNRISCHYLHTLQEPSPSKRSVPSNTDRCSYRSQTKSWKRNADLKQEESAPRRRIVRPALNSDVVNEPKKEEENPDQEKQCASDHVQEDSNKFSAPSCGSGLIRLAKLKGHNKAITGIALPSGSSTLYTVSEDNCFRAWDCNTGECTRTEVLAGKAQCIVARGPWLFVGLPNNVKVWNLQHNFGRSLDANGGQVYSLEFDNDILFAGMEDGSIFVWRWNSAGEFELAATMKEHTGAVDSLVIGSGHGKLYSGSADRSIKVWDQKLQCIQTIMGQVSSLHCWDKYLLSTTLDNRLEIWYATESGIMKNAYDHVEDQGVVTMAIMDQPESRHIILSLEDKSLRVYDFPSFVEKGRIQLEELSLVTEAASDNGLLFTGDAAGDVSVWKLAGV